MREIKVEDVEVKKCKDIGVKKPGYCLVVKLAGQTNKEYIESEFGDIDKLVEDIIEGRRFTEEASDVLSVVLFKSGVVEPEELLLMEVGEVEGQGLQPFQK